MAQRLRIRLAGFGEAIPFDEGCFRRSQPSIGALSGLVVQSVRRAAFFVQKSAASYRSGIAAAIEKHCLDWAGMRRKPASWDEEVPGFVRGDLLFVRDSNIFASPEAFDASLGSPRGRPDRISIARKVVGLEEYPSVLLHRAPPSIELFLREQSALHPEITVARTAGCIHLSVADVYDPRKPRIPAKMLSVQEHQNCGAMALAGFCLDVTRFFTPDEDRVLDLGRVLVALLDRRGLQRMIEDAGVISLSAHVVLKATLANATVFEVSRLQVMAVESFVEICPFMLWNAPCTNAFQKAIRSGVRVLNYHEHEGLFRFDEEEEWFYHAYVVSGYVGNWLFIQVTWGDIDGDDAGPELNCPYLLVGRELVAEIGTRVSVRPTDPAQAIVYRTHLLKPTRGGRVMLGAGAGGVEASEVVADPGPELPLIKLEKGVRVLRLSSPILRRTERALLGEGQR